MIEEEIINTFDKKYKYIDNNSVLGYIDIHCLYENADITDVFVKEEYRRHGIGSTLLNYVINYYKGKTLMLEVKEDNLSAIKLYEKHGFEKISERKNYYKDKTALIMRREVK